MLWPLLVLPSKQPHHSHLTRSASAYDYPLTLRTVHVASLSSDEGFVDFYVASHLPEGIALHRKSETLQHEPCCL